jgi:hypothetical protein
MQPGKPNRQISSGLDDLETLATAAASQAESAATLATSTNTLLQQHLASGETPTYKILEATDSNEYTALDANKKHWYDLFISAGTLDWSDGSKAQGVFLDWLFPPGTKTNTALMAIL